jgi:hypothetical protein
MALRYTDPETLEVREPTQADLDQLMAIRVAYGRIQARFADDRLMLVEECRIIRSRAGRPNDMAMANEPVTGDV